LAVGLLTPFWKPTSCSFRQPFVTTSSLAGFVKSVSASAKQIRLTVLGIGHPVEGLLREDDVAKPGNL
jgi:hypothetical protein